MSTGALMPGRERAMETNSNPASLVSLEADYLMSNEELKINSNPKQL